MTLNIEEIGRVAHDYANGTMPLRSEMPLVDLDDAELEILEGYIHELRKIGVDPTDESLQETLNGYPYNMEDAILVLLKHAEKLQEQHQATYLFIKALREGWKPNQQTGDEEIDRLVETGDPSKSDA